ncbi:hypothetical protein [Azospirillum sp.]|uniref:hypothetical protein n=1 Tax=Azospirillum sp. TaxID=34012 RepID=UPI003D749EFD
MRRLFLVLAFLLPACTTDVPPPSVAEVRCLDRTQTAAAQDFRDYAQSQLDNGYVTELRQSDFTSVYDRDCR